MFKQYRKSKLAEMTPVTQQEVEEYEAGEGGVLSEISISDEDRANGSPKVGDMRARNPENHADQWLVAKEFFEENYEEV